MVRILGRIAASLLLALPAVATGADATLAATPMINLPSPSAVGQQITVSGTGFCPDTSAGCSTLSVLVEQRTAASGVKVAGDGSFSVLITITEVPGQYAVIASQQTPGGQLQARHGLVVVAGERQTNPTPTPTPARTPAPSPGSGSPPPGSGEATPTAGTTPTPAPSATVTPSGGPNVAPGSGGQPPGDTGGGAPPGWVLALAALALVALVGAAVLFTRRRSTA